MDREAPTGLADDEGDVDGALARTTTDPSSSTARPVPPVFGLATSAVESTPDAAQRFGGLEAYRGVAALMLIVLSGFLVFLPFARAAITQTEPRSARGFLLHFLIDPAPGAFFRNAAVLMAISISVAALSHWALERPLTELRHLFTAKGRLASRYPSEGGPQ